MANANRAHAALCCVVIDSHAPVFEEQSEGRPAAEAVAESLCEITLAGDACQLRLCPGMEGFDLWLGLMLPDSIALVGKLAFDLALDVIELTNAIERVLGDLRFGSGPDVVEVAPEMRPAGGFTELGAAIGPYLIESFEASVSIGLQDTGAVLQMLAGMFALSIR